jgi:hypothetical protein
MRAYILHKWENHPLQLIFFVAAFFRLLAVLFSKGYGMHDDHFLIIEAAQSWVDGTDYNNWLPGHGDSLPDGHSWFYSGLHFLLFKFFNAIGFVDPDLKMYVVRLLHAAFSMITVVLGFRITEHYAGKNLARTVGLLLAVLWLFPMMSVRNLVEVVCVPFLMYATWLMIRSEKENRILLMVYAGLIAGLAFSVRFQSLFFVGGLGLTLLFQRKWKAAILFGASALFCMALIQGGIDAYLWGRPFAEFEEYVRYNINNRYSYNTKPWFNYFLTLGGLLVPPLSVMLLFGFFRSWKKYLLLFLPSFLFLAFHSYFPNKQERFIFPIIPFLIILGMIGWSEFKTASAFWKKRPKLLRGLWIFFWCVNTLPLLFISVSYSKRNRVEAMLYLQHKGDVQSLVIEESIREDFTMPPLYYLKKWVSPIGITTSLSSDSARKVVNTFPNALKANYVLFMQEDNLPARVETFRKTYGDITYETTIKPGALDELMHWLNKENKNFTCTIYKIKQP